MFKPEAYVDSVLDLLDDEQTLVAENIIKNPLDMQERYMSLVPDGLLDFIVKQWRPGMTSDQADKIFRKYSSFNQGGSVTTPKRGLVDEAGSYSGLGQKYLYKKGDGYRVVATKGNEKINQYFPKDQLKEARAYAKKVEEKFNKIENIVPSVIGKKLTVYNKYAQDIHGKNYNDLTQAEKNIVKTRYTQSGGKFRKTFQTNALTDLNQERIKKAFPDVEFEFTKGKKYGVPLTLKNGKRNPVFTAVNNFVNNNYKLSIRESLPVSTQRDIVANFELPKGVKEWNFDVKRGGYLYGISDTSGANMNLGARIKNFVNEPKPYKIAADFATPEGWLLTQMNRAFESKQNPNFIPKYDFVNGKKKIVGFIDNQYGGGKTYYALKKYADKFNGTMITEHPDFKNTKKYIDIANKAKLPPNKVIKDLLVKGGITDDRITLNNLLQYMLNEKGVAPTQRALVLHHKGGAFANPTRDFQILNMAVNQNIKGVELAMRADPKNITPKNIQFLKDAGASIVLDGKTYGGGPKTAIGGFKQAEQFVQNKLESFDDKDFKNFKKYIANIGCTDLAAGGRAGFNTGANCFLKGVEKINSGKIAKGAEARNFVKFANQAYKLGRNVLKFGVIPEMLWIGGETLIRMGMGEGLNESFKYATSFLPGGTARAKEADLSSLTKRVGLQNAKTIMNVRGANESREKLNDLYNSLETDLAFAGGDWQAQADIEKRYEKRIKDAEKEYNIKSDFGKLDDISSGANIAARRLEDEAEDIKKSKSLFTQMKNWADEIRPDTVEGDIETVSPSESDLDIGKTKTVPLFTMEDIAKNLIFDQYAKDPKEKLKILQGMREDDVNPGETDLERILFEQQQGGIPTVNEFVWRDIFSKAAENPAYAEQLYGASGMMGEPIQNSIIRANQAFPKTYGTFASGGIASLTTTIPPKRGPNHQGLASLKKYGKQY
jgi:hypothetical protein